MTIAIALKVGDGIVLGADSAATLAMPEGTNVYFNAEKIFNLVKGLPVGGAFYGLGGLQNRSMSSLLKDLRGELSDQASVRYLDPASYTVAEAATRVREVLYEERYRVEFDLVPPPPPVPPGAPAKRYPIMGVILAGYSAGADQAEVWHIETSEQGDCAGPVCVIPQDEPAGLDVGAQSEAVHRLLRGYSPRILDALVGAGIDRQEAVNFLDGQPMERLIHPPMPIQDAIDLVEYLIKMTAGFVRFAPGDLTVAEPIDVAAITRHEQFKWVRRKHYYSAELNPQGS